MNRKGSEAWKEHNRPQCVEDIREALDNPFIRDIREIQSICYEPPMCDVGVGLDKYINRHPEYRDVEDTVLAGWIKEYKYLCRIYYLDFIVECLEEVQNGDL